MKALLLAERAFSNPLEFFDHCEAIVSILIEKWFGQRPKSYTTRSEEEVISEFCRRLGQSIEIKETTDLEVELKERMRSLEKNAPFPIAHNADITLARLCYAICRILKPKIVVEAGVAYGVTTTFILKALQVNGKGELHSIDPPPLGKNSERFIGYLVPKNLRER